MSPDMDPWLYVNRAFRVVTLLGFCLFAGVMLGIWWT